MIRLDLYHLNREVYGREVRAHVVKHAIPDTYADRNSIKYEVVFKVSGVPSLGFQCRRRIRSLFKSYNPWGITEEIETLPLPERLKEYLK